VIKRDEETFIIDTKWKLMETNKPSIEDLRQIFAYDHLWKASKSLLLYPGVGKEDSMDFDPYSPSEFANGIDVHGCKVGFIDILQHRDKKEFARNIFEKLK
jgi:5-methylcytosine-specific restriction enzyme subunit McrC